MKQDEIEFEENFEQYDFEDSFINNQKFAIYDLVNEDNIDYFIIDMLMNCKSRDYENTETVVEEIFEKYIKSDRNIDVIEDSVSFYFLKNTINTMIINLNSKSSKLWLKCIVEFNYVDPYYRNSFYEYYSITYHNYPRNCIRICFFDPNLDINSEIYNIYDFSSENLNEYFLGSTVVQPVSERSIGLTLMNPKIVFPIKDYDNNYLNKDEFYVRTSLFRINLGNHKLFVRAYPFFMQDKITTTCAEVTLLGLTKYFNNEYSNYKILYPSMISSIAKEYGNERSVPSEGLSYGLISKILIYCGFEPLFKINQYNLKIQDYKWNGISSHQSIKEIREYLYYYIESGIPVGLGLKIRQDVEESLHICTCIGHGKLKLELLEDIYHRSCTEVDHKNFYYIDTVNLVNDFVIIDDDNKLLPYSVYNIDETGNVKNLQNEKYNANIVAINVPLYQKMCLKPEIARQIFMHHLFNNDYGIQNDLEEDIASFEHPIVFRMFLCSAKSYISDRIEYYKQQGQEGFCDIYLNLNLTRFLWVCEVYHKEEYASNDAFYEIILDATTSNVNDDALILINGIHHVVVKNGDGMLIKYDFSNLKGTIKTFKGFCSNLKKIDELNNKIKNKIPKK